MTQRHSDTVRSDSRAELSKKLVSSFRDLVAWQRGMEIARFTYMFTQKFPADERFGLTSQMRRAAVSIPSNIAEGFARQSRPDFLRHLRIARGSLAELSTQLDIASDIGLAPGDPQFAELLAEEAKILGGLIRSLERKVNAG